jgi:signal transduction histidine kinase
MNAPAKVLIVDDDHSVREAFEAILAPDNHELTFAPDGATALKELQTLIPDVILLDVMMPNLDGYEVCRRIKGDHRLAHVPVVLVTVLETKEDLVKGLDTGADEFLTKPVAAVELRARVRSMIRIKSQHDRLKDALKMREELANMIVHDVRAPLSVIIVHAEWFAKGEGAAPEVRKRGDSILAQAERVTAFLNDMLLLAKLEAGKLVLNRAPVHVSDLVRSAEVEHRVLAESRGISLALELPERDRYLMLDPTLLARVLDNLLSNAIKYSARGDTVSLCVRHGEGKGGRPAGVRIEVRDQGPGVPDADKARIFGEFEIVRGSRAGVSQIGLGLTFSKLAVEAHGGSISVANNEPRGSIFIVEL